MFLPLPQQTQGLHTHTLSYHYDDFGRRQRLDLPDGKRLHYRYNQHSQLTAIELSEGDSSQTLAVFQYDKQNRLIQQTFGNHIALEQTFDVFHRLTQQNLTHPEQRIYDQCAYQYDGIDQLIGRQSQTQTSQQEEGGFAQAKQEAFEYNTLGQLIKESVAYTQGNQPHSSQRKHTEFEWDSVGNPIAQRTVIESDDAKSHADEKEENKGELSAVESEENVVAFADNDPSIQAVTEGDRLLKFADIDFEYDDCGNQIRERGIGVQTERAFNAFNQLTRFAKDGVLTQYDYDPLGRRIAKHTEQGQIDFIWDGNQLLGEYQNGQYTWYINRPNEFHPVALIKQDGIYYYHLDQLNTPRFVTNQQADVVWENTANAYGYEDSKQQAEREGQSKDFYQPIRFQGQYFDQESGFHYNRFRYYCPKQQRFIHQDPIGIVGGINHYQYAPNPVNWVDPMGLMCKEGEKRLQEALDKSVASGEISEELSRDLFDAASIGFVTPDLVKRSLTDGTAASLLVLEPNKNIQVDNKGNTEFEKAPARKDRNNNSAPTVDELIDSDLDRGNSLIGLKGDEFKNHVLMNYYMAPGMEVLTREEFLSISVYTTNLYGDINGGLRGFSPEDKEKWSNVVKDANNGLEKLAKNPDFRHEGEVFRGDNFSDKLLDELFPVGEIHHEKGFKSSSYDPDKSFSGNTKITIKSKNGVRVADTASVAPHEKEVLFKSGTKFRVLSRNTLNGFTVVKLEEI